MAGEKKTSQPKEDINVEEEEQICQEERVVVAPTLPHKRIIEEVKVEENGRERCN